MVVAYSPGQRKILIDSPLSLERFRYFLPLAVIDKRLSLGEGNTPLVPLFRLRRKYGLPSILAKNETMNPTHSFKDRGTAVVIQRAVALGIKAIGTVSTGNMAASTAAYAARAGLESHVLLKADTSPAKVLSTLVFGAKARQMEGDYGQLFWQSFIIGRRRGIYFANSVDPLRIEGYKTTAYEIFLALGRRAPRYVFVPVSSGGNLVGILKGFLDLKEEGWVPEVPIFVGVQAEGCAPLARAFREGKEKIERVTVARTIAHAISNPDPPAGNLALKLIRETNGAIVDVSDKEILLAQKELASLEGIFADPASATTLAALLKIQSESRWSGSPLKKRLSGDIVLVITGSGLKTLSETTRNKKDSRKRQIFGAKNDVLSAKRSRRTTLSCCYKIK